MRRALAAVTLVILFVAAALGIHSCQVTQTDNSLKDYNTSVRALLVKSNITGDNVFKALSGRASTSNEEALQSQLDTAAAHAADQLTDAGSFSVPGQMQAAQQNLLLTLRMRRDAIATIAKSIEPAVGSTTRAAAIDAIAAANAQVYASDVVYKSYVLPEIVGALQSAGIAVGGVDGQVVDEGQVISDLGWLQPSFVATELGTPVAGSTSSQACVPGRHGHSLNFVSVAGAQLSATPASNPSISSSPPPTFTLNVTNGGTFDEYKVACKVTVATLSDTGTSAISETLPGQSSNCSVTLPSAPSPGTYQVTAEVVPVCGEKNIANNSLTFTITFS
jgi:hypothetical protein